MNQILLRKWVPITLLCILITGLMVIFRPLLSMNGFDIPFVLTANLLLFALSLFGLYIQTRSVRTPNVNAFIRGLYLSLLLKMMVIVGALLVYILVMGKGIHNPSLLTVMGFYLVYTTVEVIQLMKIARRKPDA